MTYHGHIQNGVVVLDEGVRLPEGARVEVLPAVDDTHESQDQTLQEQDREDDEPLTFYERYRDLIGSVDLPPDFALNHDHYIHGAPKREE